MHFENKSSRFQSVLSHNYGWMVMSGFWMSSLVIPMVAVSLGIMLPDMTVELSITPIQAGLLGSAFFIGTATASLPASIYLSRYSPKKVVALALLMAALLAFVQGNAANFYILMLARLLFTLTMVSRAQAEIILIKQWFGLRQFAFVVSLAVGILSTGNLLGVGITAWLMDIFSGWRNVYYFLGIVLLIEMFIWIAVGKDKPDIDISIEPDANEDNSPSRVLFGNKTVWILAICPTGAALAFGSVMTFWPTYALETLNLDLKTVGLLMTLFPVGGTVASFLGGPLSEKAGQRKIFIWLPGLLLPIIYIFLFTTTSTTVTATLLLLAGWNAMIWVPVLRTIQFDLGFAPRETAVVVGLSMTIIPVGGAIGPPMVGLIQEISGSLQYGLLGIALFPITLVVGGLLIPETIQPEPLHTIESDTDV